MTELDHWHLKVDTRDGEMYIIQYLALTVEETNFNSCICVGLSKVEVLALQGHRPLSSLAFPHHQPTTIRLEYMTRREVAMD